MISIRNYLFETNSSSVHALVIPKDAAVHFPSRVVLSGGEYGWEEDTEYDTLNYIYQACVDRGQDELQKLYAYLKRHNIEFTENYSTRFPYGYIDHDNEVPLDELFKNESMLDRFLFSDNSCVVTGNDNVDFDEYSVEARVEENYPEDKYDILYKYN